MLMRNIGRKIQFIQTKAVDEFVKASDEGYDTSTRLLTLFTYLGCLGYELSGKELLKYIALIELDITDEQIQAEIAGAWQAGIILLADDEITRPFKALRVSPPGYMPRLAADVAGFRKRYFGAEDTPKEVKAMKIAMTSCKKHGRFEIQNTEGIQIHYVKYSPIPRARVMCPGCGTTIMAKLDRHTATLFQDLGVPSSHWTDDAAPIDESEVDQFMENFDTEIEALLL